MDKNDLIVENDDEIIELVGEYMQAKGDNFVVIPMEDRVKLFLALVKDSDYAKESFEKVAEFKELFFPKDNIAKLGLSNLDNHFTTFVIGDKSSKENKLIVLYNANGVNNNESIDENNTLAFEISFKEHAVKQLSVKELKGKIVCDSYRPCKCAKFDEVEQEQADGTKTLKEAFKEYLALTTSRQA